MIALWFRRLWPFVLAAVLLLGASLTYQHLHAWHGMAPAVRDSVVALQTSRRPDSLAHAAAVQHAEAALVQSGTARAASVATERHAQDAGAAAAREAELARAAQTASDSAAHWREAYTLEQGRGDSLQVALVQERAATDSATAAALSYQRADSVSQARLARTERLNASLVEEVARASSGCRLLPGIPCPSRKVSLLLGAAGAVAVARLRR